jgi:hypothetical protein
LAVPAASVHPRCYRTPPCRGNGSGGSSRVLSGEALDDGLEVRGVGINVLGDDELHRHGLNLLHNKMLLFTTLNTREKNHSEMIFVSEFVVMVMVYIVEHWS